MRLYPLVVFILSHRSACSLNIVKYLVALRIADTPFYFGTDQINDKSYYDLFRS